MPLLNNLHHGNGLYFMLKGEPGTRKSTAALSFPMPQYWFSTDQKMEALIYPARLQKIDMSGVEYDSYTQFSSLEARLKKFRSRCEFKTVILDSITSVGDCINNETLAVKIGSSGTVKKIGSIEVNSIEDYMAEMRAFQSILALTKDIQRHHKLNIILIAHVIGQRDPDKVGVAMHSRVIITGGKSISGKIASYCTEVYHFQIQRSAIEGGEGKYEVVTENTGFDYARTSLGLAKKFELGSKQLYPEFIKPAIDKMVGDK